MELDVKSVLIFWDPGHWKTAMASVMSLDYKRVYSNVDFFIHRKKTNKRIKGMDDINKIPYDPLVKGVIIIDEMWVNGNARRSQSESNMTFGELDMLKRKKNCDLIWIAQLFRMFDVYQRELAALLIEMRKFHKPWYKRPFFNARRLESKINSWTKVHYTAEREIDIFQIHKEVWMEYDQLSESRLETKKEKDE